MIECNDVVDTVKAVLFQFSGPRQIDMEIISRSVVRVTEYDSVVDTL